MFPLGHLSFANQCLQYPGFPSSLLLLSSTFRSDGSCTRSPVNSGIENLPASLDPSTFWPISSSLCRLLVRSSVMCMFLSLSLVETGGCGTLAFLSASPLRPSVASHSTLLIFFHSWEVGALNRSAGCTGTVWDAL